MAHTYANVATFKDYLRDNGAEDLGQGNDALYRVRLEAASRRVDAYCARSEFGSGFGPRLGTNHYDGNGGACLRLRDDLLSVTSIALRGSTNGSAQAPVITTDFYLDDPSPYREIRLHGGGIAAFGSGYRVTDVVAEWGYQDVRVTLATTVASGLASDATARQFIASAAPEFSPGDTLRIGDEQLYVLAVDGTTVTAERGANGTTAATHADASPIAVYHYPSQSVDGTCAVAARRLRVRDAGLTADYGGGSMPSAGPRDTEVSILRATVGADLRLPEPY